MNRQDRRKADKKVAKVSATLPASLTEIDAVEWGNVIPGLLRMWHSRRWIVELHAAPVDDGPVLGKLVITPNLHADRAPDNMDVHTIKNVCGFGGMQALEVHPASDPTWPSFPQPSTRTLWLLRGGVDLGWGAIT